jgi:uncharacterized membrane protein (DUF2068 family)
MPRPRTARRTAASEKSSTTLLLIALFKLFKGMLLVVVGIGALKLLHHDTAQTLNHWVNVLRADPDNHYIHSLLSRILSASPNQLKATSAGTFIYASLLLTEGFGLLFRKVWAEYFTIVTTAALIPLEVYELAKHPSTAKTGILIINAAIVVYLVRRIRRSA